MMVEVRKVHRSAHDVCEWAFHISRSEVPSIITSGEGAGDKRSFQKAAGLVAAGGLLILRHHAVSVQSPCESSAKVIEGHVVPVILDRRKSGLLAQEVNVVREPFREANDPISRTLVHSEFGLRVSRRNAR